MNDGSIPANDLEYWASVGDLKEVESALANGIDVNIKRADGYTAIHAPAENARLDVLQFLIQQGSEIDPKLESGRTPLQLAELAGHQSVVELLLKHGARRQNLGDATSANHQN